MDLNTTAGFVVFNLLSVSVVTVAALVFNFG